jgi:hypothetical protein
VKKRTKKSPRHERAAESGRWGWGRRNVELEEKTGGARERCRRWTRKGAASEPVTLDFILGVSRNLSDGVFF